MFAVVGEEGPRKGDYVVINREEKILQMIEIGRGSESMGVIACWHRTGRDILIRWSICVV